MTKRSVAFIIVGAALAALLIGGAVALGQQPQSDRVEAALSAPTSALPTSAASSPATVPTPSPSASVPPEAAPSPGAEAPEGNPPAAEVLPPVPDDALMLPRSTPPPDLITTPLPATASATGKIVPGFPSDLIPTAPKSKVVASSVASEGSHLQAALTAKSTLSPTDVLAYYRTAFAPFGLLDTPAPAAAGSSALTFTRGTDSVTLTVTGVTGGSTYIVFGALTAAG